MSQFESIPLGVSARLFWAALKSLGFARQQQFIERRPYDKDGFEFFAWPAPKIRGNSQWFRVRPTTPGQSR